MLKYSTKGRERQKEKDKESDRSERKPERNRKDSSSREETTIKFFHNKDSKNAKLAAEENSPYQLQVHGLESGPQERKLNTLMTRLRTSEVREDGFNIEQRHIIGAIRLVPSSSGDRSPVTRLTLNSRETKERIRKAAEAAKRWGDAGNKVVFFRDIYITPNKQTNKQEKEVILS